MRTPSGQRTEEDDVMDPVQLTISGVLLSGIGVLAGVVKYLYSEMGKLREAELACRANLSSSRSETASLRAELTSFMAMWDQQRADGVVPLRNLEATLVVSAKTRKIRDWNIGASLILGWDRQDVMGKAASLADAAASQDEAKIAWDNLYIADRAPAKGPFKVRVLTRTGADVPMTMTLSAWQDDQETLVACDVATTRQRQRSLELAHCTFLTF